MSLWVDEVHYPTHLFAVLYVRLAAEVLCVEVLKVRLSHSDWNAHSQIGVVDERHVVLIDHVFAHTAANTTCGAIAVLGIVQVSVDVHSSVIGNEV